MDRPFQQVLRQLSRLHQRSLIGGLSDAELVRRFVAGCDEAAFEVLVWRHGSMVYNVCRRVLEPAG